MSLSRRLVGGPVALLVIAVLALTAWLAERPPAPAPADAPAGAFSAVRAARHLDRIATLGPTPIGTPGDAAVRKHLVGALRGLGLRTEVQTGVGMHGFRSHVVVGQARNVVATLPGAAPTGRVLLAAHYDTTPPTPGTSDDKASVAAILEIARALAGGERPRNDVVLLLSDGEEPGLIGAEAFARHHPLARDGGVMINLEGPGNAGPSMVYNTSAHNAGVVAAFAGAPHPVGESAVTGFFRAGRFNTDFTTLQRNGFVGLELGWREGRAYYHHPRDTVDAFDLASLQAQGDNALALTRRLAAADIPELRAGGDDTFFSVYRTVIHYPEWLVWPLALLGVVAVLGLAVLARARGAATARRMLLAAGTAVLPPLLGAVGAVGLWALLVAVRPGYLDMAGGVYRPALYVAALGALSIAVGWAWHALLRGRLGGVALGVGALAWLALLGVGLAWLLPGASGYGSLPALAGALGGGAALVLGERRRALAVVALALGALPGVVLLALGGWSLVGFMGVGLAAPGVALGVLAVMSGVRLLGRPRSRARAVGGPLAAAVVAVALAAAGLSVDRFDDAHPYPTHLAYVLDATSGRASWVSTNQEPDRWLARYVPTAADAWRLPLPSGTVPTRTGPAEAVPLPAPELVVLDQRAAGGEVELDVRVRSRRDAYELNLFVDRPVEAASISVAGGPFEPLPSATPAQSRWPVEVQLYALPADGARLTLRTRGRPRLAVSDTSLGLAGLPGYQPRPAGVDKMSARGNLDTDTVTVTSAPAPQE